MIAWKPAPIGSGVEASIGDISLHVHRSRLDGWFCHVLFPVRGAVSGIQQSMAAACVFAEEIAAQGDKEMK